MPLWRSSTFRLGELIIRHKRYAPLAKCSVVGACGAPNSSKVLISLKPTCALASGLPAATLASANLVNRIVTSLQLALSSTPLLPRNLLPARDRFSSRHRFGTDVKRTKSTERGRDST